MRIKKDDIVVMRSGKDRGKQGKVLQVIPVERKVVVEGLNMFVKHLAPQGGRRRRTEGAEKGQRIELSRPVPISTVQLVCKMCSKPSRIDWKILKDGTKTRHCKKCDEVIS